jgi:hypothetical protein
MNAQTNDHHLSTSAINEVDLSSSSAGSKGKDLFNKLFYMFIVM